MKKPINRVAVIHDLCGVGKAALTNVIPVLSILGVEVCPIPTVILSTHTGGFGHPSIVNLDGYIKKAMKHYAELNIEFEGIFIGYLGSNINIEETVAALNSIKNQNSLIIFDPIFADNGKYYSNFDETYSNNVKRIMTYAQIITPNFTEACILAGEDIKDEISESDLLTIVRKLQEQGAKDIIITSVPLKEKNKIGTVVYTKQNDSIEIVIRDRLNRSYPGTGDIFTSVVCGLIINGASVIDSVNRACEFVERCIEESNKYDYPTKEGVLLEKVLTELIPIKEEINHK